MNTEELIQFLKWAEKTHPVWINNLKEGYKRHKEMIQ